ncbi:MAG TPA: SDR family NAD(P)-dependent oxidoreductase [Steroidobacteraceae bacterium]|nr:SDR family NAD(P)-dependent oxidoreductase [Steroidobacteraceae bacterium]
MDDVAVITGTTHGIGRVTSGQLAREGRTVVMLCRDLCAGEAVRAEIVAQVPRASVHVVRCDLASLASVRESAAVVRRDYPRLGLLINNAGMVSVRHRLSADGFELTFATNHLGPFLLTLLLVDALGEGARIVNVASRAHLRGRLDLDEVTNPNARYRSVAAYARSKLANILFTFALARRLARARIDVNCLHPGVVATNLLPRWLRLVKPLFSEVIDVERGARTTQYLALSASVAGVTGRYFDEHRRATLASALANDVQLQEALWRMSCLWTGAPEIGCADANPQQIKPERGNGSGRSTEVNLCNL